MRMPERRCAIEVILNEDLGSRFIVRGKLELRAKLEFPSDPETTPEVIRASLARVQIVPVHERVEAQDERALTLPAPERPDREHDDVALADGRVDELRTILEILRAEHAARE